MARSRAYRRHQAARATARARRLIVVVLGHRADSADEFAPSQEWVDRMVRAYATDRTHGRGWEYVGPDIQGQRAALDAREQYAEAGEHFALRRSLESTTRAG